MHLPFASKRFFVYCACIIAVITSMVRAASWDANNSFYSLALDDAILYDVLLPDRYATTNLAYPVLYMLHGRDETYTCWRVKSNILSNMPGRDFIVVMPEGDNSWYMGDWLTMIAEELPADVANKFRISSIRGIDGFSMGGYGAFHTAGKMPNKYYISVGSMSGAFVEPDIAKVLDDVDIDTSIVVAQSLAFKAAPIYFDCGNEDVFDYLSYSYDLAKRNDEMRDNLITLGRVLGQTPATSPNANLFYYRPTGAHTWNYWNSRIPYHLDFHQGEFFKPYLTITSVTEDVTTIVTTNRVRVAGIAEAFHGVTSVTYKTKMHGDIVDSGTATIISNMWYADVKLEGGRNNLTVTAYAYDGFDAKAKATLFLRNTSYRIRMVKVKENKIIAKVSDFTYGNVNELVQGTGGCGYFTLDGFTYDVTNQWELQGNWNAKYKIKNELPYKKIKFKVKGNPKQDKIICKFKLDKNATGSLTNFYDYIHRGSNITFSILFGSYGETTNITLDAKGKYHWKGQWY